MKFVNNTPEGILTELGVRYEAKEIAVFQNFNFLSLVSANTSCFPRLLYRCPSRVFYYFGEPPPPVTFLVITIIPLSDC